MINNHKWQAIHSHDNTTMIRRSKIEVPRDAWNAKSENMTSSNENGLNIKTNASPKMGQDQVSGGVSVLCLLAAPVAMFYGNLWNLAISSKSVITISYTTVKDRLRAVSWSKNSHPSGDWFPLPATVTVVQSNEQARNIFYTKHSYRDWGPTAIPGREVVKIQTETSTKMYTYFFTHMKQNLYSLCSQPGGNSWRLGSISHTGTSMMFCP